MNGRVYDPLIGRFLSADPNVFYPENQQDFNRYSYVHNNPLSFVDPSGFSVALEDWEMSGYGVGMGFDQLQYAIANSSFQTMNNYYAYGNITNSYTTGTVTVSGIQSTAASNQNGAASVNTGNTGANSGSASTGGSALGNLARNIPVLGGMLGSVADVASGFLNVVAGAASFGLSGTLSHGIGQMGYGATQMGDDLPHVKRM
ncbi:MAG: RHS repeat-associated core domain-containing protein [Pseudomonadota bacterium]